MEEHILDEFDRMYAERRRLASSSPTTPPVRQSESIRSMEDFISAGLMESAVAQPPSVYRPITTSDLEAVVERLRVPEEDDDELYNDNEINDLLMDDDDVEIVPSPSVRPITEIHTPTRYFDPTLPYKFDAKTALEKTIVEACEEIYPGLYSLDRYGNLLAITILFRDVKIRNSRGVKHDIKDLFVKVHVDLRNSSMHSTMTGIRGQLAPGEIISDYAHSHLPGRCIGGFGDFCLGSDYIIDCLVAVKMFDYDHSLYKKKLIGFLFQLNEYVSYESLEGRPYRYIDKIGIPARSNLNENQIREQTRLLALNAKSSNFFPDYTIDINTGVVQIVDSEEYESFLLKHSGFHQQRDQNGIYFTPGGMATRESVLEHFRDAATINFRNQSFKIQPLDDGTIAKEKESSKQKYCHRSIKQRFEAYLKNHIKYEWYKLSRGILERECEESIGERRKSENKQRLSLKDCTIVLTDL